MTQVSFSNRIHRTVIICKSQTGEFYCLFWQITHNQFKISRCAFQINLTKLIYQMKHFGNEYAKSKKIDIIGVLWTDNLMFSSWKFQLYNKIKRKNKLQWLNFINQLIYIDIDIDIYIY